MKTSISALHFDWNDVAECFEKAGEQWGLDGVEFSFFSGLERPHCTAEDFRRIRPEARKHGITAMTGHVWEDPAQLGPVLGPPAILRWLEACTYAGIKGMIIHGGTYPDQRVGLRRVRKVIEKVIGRFEQEGVVLNLENVRGATKETGLQLFSQAWEFAELMDAIDSPALRFCLDTGHANIAGNIEELVYQFGPRLNHIHLHDNRGREDEHLPYARGTIDWRGLFALLNEAGFNGTFCIEFRVEGRRGPFQACMYDIRATFGL